MTTRIPMTITHDEFIEALKPLHDLLNVSANEIVGDLHIIALPSPHLYDVRFAVVAQAPDESTEFPPATLADGHPQDDEFAIWTHQVNVEVFG